MRSTSNAVDNICVGSECYWKRDKADWTDIYCAHCEKEGKMRQVGGRPFLHRGKQVERMNGNFLKIFDRL